jgi:hypothetical protein
MPTHISVTPPDPVDPVVLDALAAVEADYPPLGSEQAAIADLRAGGAGDAEVGRIGAITKAINHTSDQLMRLLLSRPPIYLQYLREYVALPSRPARAQAAREHIQARIREDGEAVEKLVDQTVQRVTADVPEVVGVRNVLERILREEGLRTGPDEPYDQVRRLAARLRADPPTTTGAATAPVSQREELLP